MTKLSQQVKSGNYPWRQRGKKHSPHKSHLKPPQTGNRGESGMAGMDICSVGLGDINSPPKLVGNSFTGSNHDRKFLLSIARHAGLRLAIYSTRFFNRTDKIPWWTVSRNRDGRIQFCEYRSGFGWKPTLSHPLRPRGNRKVLHDIGLCQG